jgi:hypothetical protein
MGMEFFCAVTVLTSQHDVKPFVDLKSSGIIMPQKIKQYRFLCVFRWGQGIMSKLKKGILFVDWCG